MVTRIRQDSTFTTVYPIHGLEGHVLGVLDDPVMLGVEHLMHRSQRPVLVGAAVASDEVRVEQFVVVGGGSTLALGTGGTVGIGVAQGGVAILHQGTADPVDDRHGGVGDVIKEGMAKSEPRPVR